MRTPIDHMSHFSLYLALMTSGAINLFKSALMRYCTAQLRFMRRLSCANTPDSISTNWVRPSARDSFAFGHAARQAKIDEFDGAAGIDRTLVDEDEVFGLEVAVHEALFVHEESHTKNAAHRPKSHMHSDCLRQM